jgi:hypothetical protein
MKASMNQTISSSLKHYIKRVLPRRGQRRCNSKIILEEILKILLSNTTVTIKA